jgi:dsDNA-specific endonuclease/ATPase MutS2
MFVDADELQEAMQTPEEQMHPQVMRVSAAEKRAQQKQDRNAIIEVDLHADELLDTLAGLDSKDILLYQLKVFRETLNEHLKERGRRVVFIHGKGDGVLRKALLDELKRKYSNCRHQDASFQEYGFGATMVTIK